MVARGLHQIEPLQAVGAIVGVLHLARDDLGGLNGDVRIFLHLGIHGEHALGADAATAGAALLFQHHDAQALLGRLDRSREARVASTANADVAIVGSHRGIGRRLLLGAIALARARHGRVALLGSRRTPSDARTSGEARYSGKAQKSPTCNGHTDPSLIMSVDSFGRPGANGAQTIGGNHFCEQYPSEVDFCVVG